MVSPLRVRPHEHEDVALLQVARDLLGRLVVRQRADAGREAGHASVDQLDALLAQDAVGRGPEPETGRERDAVQRLERFDRLVRDERGGAGVERAAEVRQPEAVGRHRREPAARLLQRLLEVAELLDAAAGERQNHRQRVGRALEPDLRVAALPRMVSASMRLGPVHAGVSAANGRRGDDSRHQSRSFTLLSSGAAQAPSLTLSRPDAFAPDACAEARTSSSTRSNGMPANSSGVAVAEIDRVAVQAIVAPGSRHVAVEQRADQTSVPVDQLAVAASRRSTSTCSVAPGSFAGDASPIEMTESPKNRDAFIRSAPRRRALDADRRASGRAAHLVGHGPDAADRGAAAHRVAHLGAVTGREHAGHAGPPAVVDDDASLETRRRCLAASHGWLDALADHDQVGRQLFAVVEPHRLRRASGRGSR